MIKTNGKMSKMEQVNKKWGNMSKDPDLRGPLGGLCNILFPKKYNRKYMYQSFFTTERNIKEIHHTRSFYDYVRECSKITSFHLSLKYIFFNIFAHIFLIMFLTWQKILATNWTNFAI